MGIVLGVITAVGLYVLTVKENTIKKNAKLSRILKNLKIR